MMSTDRAVTNNGENFTTVDFFECRNSKDIKISEYKVPLKKRCERC